MTSEMCRLLFRILTEAEERADPKLRGEICRLEGVLEEVLGVADGEEVRYSSYLKTYADIEVQKSHPSDVRYYLAVALGRTDSRLRRASPRSRVDVEKYIAEMLPRESGDPDDGG